MSTTSQPGTGATETGATGTNQPSLSEAQRITALFSSPSKTFADLQQKASWFKPFAVICLLTLLFIVVVDRKIGFTAVTHNLMESRPKEMARIESLSPADRQQAWDFTEKITKISSYATPVFIAAIAAIVSLVLWLIFHLAMGAQLSYKRMLSIFMYSSLPVGIVKTVLLLIILFVGMGSDNFRIDNPIGSNLGYYLSVTDTPRFLYSIATSVDLFTLWTVILIGIGVASLTKVKRGTAIGTVIGCWLIWIVIQGGFSGLSA